MRKPRDYDAELEVLDQKARTLRQRKIMQLGELVIGCGGDALPIEILAGALLAAVGLKDEAARAAWARAGEAMFRGQVVRSARGAGKARTASSPRDGDAEPAAGDGSAG